jgi:hypothetical protein
MPYRDLPDAIALANRGMGSLALSLFTFDRTWPRVRAGRRLFPRPHDDSSIGPARGKHRPRLPCPS